MTMLNNRLAMARTSWSNLLVGETYALTFIVISCNAMLTTVLSSVRNDGLWFSIANTFGVSIIAWAALWIGSQFSLENGEKKMGGLDKVVVSIAGVSCLIPFGPVGWVVLSTFALYSIVSKNRMDGIHRAGWVFLALSVPMFWSKRLFNFFSDFFLSIDASLVSSVTHTQRIANLVEIPGGSGFLEIAPRCSSMANVSLALLCWVLFTQASRLRWRPQNLVYCAVACVGVVGINVIRISLIGYFPQKYDLLHGAVGSTVTSWLTLSVVLLVCSIGVKRLANNSTF